ncbi:Gag-Pol polyprotein [Sesamum angolense]|uniref:Gag-Pol polyprotein n=1 Tax=Sesamum angolense TaxID=2727404 RepID=A0AAE1T987_9LAMI|nr:Gag-Pol polyprotein [Sesamum angolense]
MSETPRLPTACSSVVPGYIKMQVLSTKHQCFKYYRNGIVKKVLGDNKYFTEVESHFADAKYYIEDAKKGNEINMNQPSKPPLKGFVPSTQEGERRHDTLAIEEKGFDPKAFKLLIKAGYNPKEKLSLGKLPPENTGKKLHELNAAQIMLKEKGHAIQDSLVGLGFTPPKPVRITIKRVNSNYVSEGFSSTEDHKRKENLRESVFNRLGPHRKVLHEIANRQSVFDRVLKAKAQIVIFTQVQSDDEDDKKSVASSNYISNSAEEDIVQTYHITLIEDALSPVRKKNGQILVCVDFRDLNNACPKYDFPLPIAKLMIDATTSHEALSFMDGSSRYNQICMAPADEELTAFHTPKVGIEIEEAKIDTILRIPEPRNIHELKSLQGKLAYLQRFISNLVGRCQPFSRLMKKDVPFQWDEACDKAFKSIKSYLMKPPILVAPAPRHPLIIYVAAQERFVGICLLRRMMKERRMLYVLADHPMPAEWELSDDLPDEDVFMIAVTPP